MYEFLLGFTNLVIGPTNLHVTRFIDCLTIVNFIEYCTVTMLIKICVKETSAVPVSSPSVQLNGWTYSCHLADRISSCLRHISVYTLPSCHTARFILCSLKQKYDRPVKNLSVYSLTCIIVHRLRYSYLDSSLWITEICEISCINQC